MVRFNGYDLYINEKKISFEREIYKTLELEAGVIVLTHGFLTHGSLDEQNVYFVNLHGTIKWQIEHLGMPREAGYQGFTYIKVNSDGILVTCSFRGVECKVDLETGKIYERVGERD